LSISSSISGDNFAHDKHVHITSIGQMLQSSHTGTSRSIEASSFTPSSGLALLLIVNYMKDQLTHHPMHSSAPLHQSVTSKTLVASEADSMCDKEAESLCCE
jgi:hypothetical protein